MKSNLFFLLLFLLSEHSQAQVISKFFTSPILNLPAGMAMDKYDNLYVAIENTGVYKISPAGMPTLVAPVGAGFSGDGGPATNASLVEPMGVTVDNAGNIYIADMGNERIRMVNTAGIITTIAGNSPMTGSGGFSGDGGPATDAELSQPAAVVVDKAGNVFIGDVMNGRIRKINKSGIISTFTKVNGAISMILDSLDNMYVAEYYGNRVLKITPAGIITVFAGTGYRGGGGYFGGDYNGDGIPATSAHLNAPTGVALDPFGNVYIAEQMNQRIRKVDPSGMISTICGDGVKEISGDNGPAPLARMSWPYGIAVDNSGNNIYLSDHIGNSIRRINNLAHIPYFVKGHSQSINFCHDTLVVDPLIAAADLDSGYSLNWSILSGPKHGTLNTAYSYSMLSTGGTVVPSGLNYTRDAGYTGNDTFKVAVTEGVITDSTTIYIYCNALTVEHITAESEQKVAVFPNPSTGKFAIHIGANTNQTASIVVTDLLGKKYVELSAAVNENIPVELTGASGIYFVSITIGNMTYNKRILIQQ